MWRFLVQSHRKRILVQPPRVTPPAAHAEPHDGERRAKGGALSSRLAVISILTFGGSKRGEPGHDGAREDPGAGAGRETRGQQPVVDLPRDRKTVVAPR